MRIVAVIAFLSIALGVSWLVAQRHPGSTAGESPYVCPMHSSYTTSHPGNCPVCGMELVRVSEHPVASSSPTNRLERATIGIRPEQQRVLGISLAEAKTVLLAKTIHATGHVSLAPPDRMPASDTAIVDHVYRSPSTSGALRLRAGEPILSLNGAIVRAAGPMALLSVPQIGQRAEKGKELLFYTDLSTVFVLADIRSTDIPFISPGLEAKAMLAAHPGKAWRGSVLETSPQFDERMQTLKVKLQFPNAEPEIWAGMLASIEIESKRTPVLAIPETAVIADGESTVVFVAQAHDIFEPRQIETGLRAKSMIEVKRGLAEGERVATAATFLLDSESRLRATALR